MHKHIHMISNIFRNKYFLTALLFLLWILLFDANNLIRRYKALKNIDNLKKDKIYFRQRIDNARTRINELQTDSKNLEKFAREQYMMKKDNEDLFLLEEEEE